MTSHISRNTAYSTAAFFFIFSLALCTGCGMGGNAHSTATNNPSAGGTQPSSGGSSGTGTSGGTGTTGTGGSGTGTGGSGGSGGGSSTGASYLYVGVAIENAAIRGYKVDTTNASIAEVAGSPFAQQGPESGVVAVSKTFVYTSTANVADSSTNVFSLRADATSGSLTQTGSVIIARGGPAALFPDPSGQNLYALTAIGDIATFTINSTDGTLTSAGPLLHLADGVGSLAISPNGQLAYVTISNGNFKAGTLTGGTVALNRSTNSGALTINHQVNSDQHLNDLQFDPSGKYLLATGGDNDSQIYVYSVNYSTGDLTAVPGSPFASAGASPAPNFTRSFRFDASGKFVYALDANLADPRPENVWVLAFSSTTGTLAPIQTFDVPVVANPISLVVDQSLAFVINSGTNPSTITVLKRDPTSGLLSAGGNPLSVPGGLGMAGEVHF